MRDIHLYREGVETSLCGIVLRTCEDMYAYAVMEEQHEYYNPTQITCEICGLMAFNDHILPTDEKHNWYKSLEVIEQLARTTWPPKPI